MSRDPAALGFLRGKFTLVLAAGGHFLTERFLHQIFSSTCGAAVGWLLRLSERPCCKSKTLQSGYLLTSVNTMKMVLAFQAASPSATEREKVFAFLGHL